MASYVDKLLIYNNGGVQKIQSSDSVGLTGDFSVGGNLLVSGDIVASETMNVLIGDSFLDLSSGYINNVTAKASGLTFNVKATTGFTALTATDFTAGVVATSAPMFTCSATVSTLVAGDIVQISSAAIPGNNGLFVVASVADDEVTVYGIGGTSIPAYALFCQNQFTASTGNTATITKVDLAALAIADGVSIKDATGAAYDVGKLVRAYYAGAELSDFNGTAIGTGWSEVGASTTQTLQAAYEGGNSISLSDTEGDLAITVGSGTAAVSITANKASQFVVSSADLSLGTTTSGLVAVSSAGALDLDSASALSINSSAGAIGVGDDAAAQAINVGTGAAARTLTLGNATGATTLDLNAGTGGVTVDTTSGGAISIDAVGARSNLTVTNERLDLQSVGSFATGTQVLVEATNSAGTSQVVVQADSNVVMQAPATSPSLYFLADADAATAFVAMEADDNGAGIYIGSEPFNSFIAVGTDGARIIDIGNSNGGTEVNLYAAAGVSVTGTLTGDNYIRPGVSTFSSTPTGVEGALIYDTTASEPKWYDGSTWRTFGSLAASTLQEAYEGGNSIVLASAEGDLTISNGGGSAAVTIDTNKASWFKVTGAAMSLQTVTSGALDVTSAGVLDLDAVGALSLNSSGAAISIGNDAVSQNIDLGTAGVRTITIGSASATAVNVDAVAVSVDATSASNFTVTGANLTVSTVTSGAVAVTSAGLMDLDAASVLSINSSGAAIDIGNDANNFDISIGSGGTRSIKLGSVTASVLLGTSSSSQGVIGTYLPVASASGIVKGNILYVQATSGEVAKADGDDTGTREVIGVALEAGPGSAGDMRVGVVPGSVIPMKFAAAPSGSGDIGSPVYLSTTPGQATLSAPVAGRVYRLGVLLSASADADGNYKALYLPAFIADL